MYLLPLFLQQLACMNMPSRTQNYKPQHSSETGNMVFKLNPLTSSNKYQIVQKQLNFDDFYIGNGGDFSELFTASIQLTAFNQLFGFPVTETNNSNLRSPVDTTNASKNPNTLFQSKRYESEDSSKKQDIIYLAGPNIDMCLICKQKFTNYFQHLKHHLHIKRQKTTILLSEKPKVKLESALSRLVKSLEAEQGKHPSFFQGKPSRKREKFVHYRHCLYEPLKKKRRKSENRTTNCDGSSLSTSLTDSRSQIQRESFFLE